LNASAYGESIYSFKKIRLFTQNTKRKSLRLSSEAFAFSLHIFGGLNASAYGESISGFKNLDYLHKIPKEKASDFHPRPLLFHFTIL